jgi:hypothetical protein
MILKFRSKRDVYRGKLSKVEVGKLMLLAAVLIAKPRENMNRLNRVLT